MLYFALEGVLMAGQKKKREDLAVLDSIPVEQIVTMFEAGKVNGADMRGTGNWEKGARNLVRDARQRA